MKSDKQREVEGKIIAVSAEYIEKMRRQNIVLWVLIVFAVISFTLQFAVLVRLSSDTKKLGESNNRILSSQIAALEKDLKDRDKTIADQNSVIDQSVAAILRLAKQVKDLGGDPGEITIKPPSEEQ